VNAARNVTQLLSNPAVTNVLLTANGMSDQIGYTALAIKALTSDLSDPSSLVNTLSDTRWKTLAQTYNFGKRGKTPGGVSFRRVGCGSGSGPADRE
jgi:hypothetical protein